MASPDGAHGVQGAREGGREGKGYHSQYYYQPQPPQPPLPSQKKRRLPAEIITKATSTRGLELLAMTLAVLKGASSFRPSFLLPFFPPSLRPFPSLSADNRNAYSYFLRLHPLLSPLPYRLQMPSTKASPFAPLSARSKPVSLR